ncbi:MAG: hypothetical protein AAGJ80_14110 [Cyanobacteria bacterium J06553_1]
MKEHEEMVERKRREFEEERLRMEEEIKAAERRLKEEGVIYGERYGLYSFEEILNITNYDFLSKMLSHVFPPGQPQTEDEYKELWERYDFISRHMDDVLINDLE